MFFYVASLPERADEGVNIGSGVLLLWWLVSLVLLLVLVLRDLTARAIRFVRTASRT
jgi:hypothetical protein